MYSNIQITVGLSGSSGVSKASFPGSEICRDLHESQPVTLSEAKWHKFLGRFCPRVAPFKEAVVLLRQIGYTDVLVYNLHSHHDTVGRTVGKPLFEICLIAIPHFQIDEALCRT